jgi:hypothetical protein
MFYLIFSVIIPLSFSYYNYIMYKRLEDIYTKLDHMNKKLNYYLTYQYVEPIDPNSDVIISSSTNEYTLPYDLDNILENIDQKKKKSNNDEINKIYLVL